MNDPKDNLPADGICVWDSLNIEVVEVTGGEVDLTIRPMRESLRKRLHTPAVPTQQPRREEKCQ